MTDDTVGLHEERVRVICHLPCGNDKEEHAFYDIIKYLQSQVDAEIPVTGYTHSAIRPCPFFGYWFGKPPRSPRRAHRRWVEDKVVLMMIDYQLNFTDMRVSALVKALSEKLVVAYQENDCKQKEFWIVAQQGFRHT